MALKQGAWPSSGRLRILLISWEVYGGLLFDLSRLELAPIPQNGDSSFSLSPTFHSIQSQSERAFLA